MTNPIQSIQDALHTYDQNADKDHLEAGQQERAEFLERFPLEKWPEMTLKQYALGQENSTETYCRWLEFVTIHLGSMSGGSSAKHLIYKHKNKPGWYFHSKYADERQAWEAIHQAFLEAFKLAKNSEWLEIDDLEALQRGRALRVKTLHLYFPDEIMPVYSRDHILYFLKRLDVFGEEMKNWEVIRLNRTLLTTLKNIPELQNWTTNQLERLLYHWADPRETRRVVKIAPGEKAKFWPECLANSYICVGWDDVGDLREFDSQEEFREKFDLTFADHYNNNKSTLTKKSKEVWSLLELEAGDLIIANQGTSKILAVGEVQDPAYEWRPDRHEFKHTVRVKWDTRYEQEIEPQNKWISVTVASIPVELYQRILTHKQNGEQSTVSAVAVPVPQFYLEMAEALERKGQAILYGPPGTGKTYHARQFATWWLLQHQQASEAQAVLANPELRATWEKRLTTTQVARRVWWIVANPKQWSWEQLFDKKSETYKYGRLRRNYPLVQRGDLVVGYQAAPDKRIMALAHVTKGLNEMTEEGVGLEIEPVCRLPYGLSYAELQTHPILKNSEPMRHSCQGTLFALTELEADSLMATLSERDPKLETYIDTEAGIGPLTWTTFHPSYAYEDFVEGFRPDPSSNEGLVLRLEDGLFKRICREAQPHPKRRYLLIIDEINRANLAKVFGELITLLEKDKRGLVVTLPQSKESFTIPPNVYLLGTMNTADRSIKLLDVALRRRFAFLEVMPDLELLRGATVNNLPLDDFLMMLNLRIAQTEGREKQIGHASLLQDGQPITEPEEFARRFRQEILPLLQEYCYDDYATLATYLGESLVDVTNRSLKENILNDAELLIETLSQLVKAGEPSP